MSFADMKAEIPRLTVEELDELSACVEVARMKLDRSWVEEAARINADMDQGRKYTEEEVLRIHEDLTRRGL